ncbi:ATP-binding protein [Collinsella intestinalis]|uniref:ATP-binding protein n=1 Tax=Collinsella intestinalis TaxID=147207 RepID=UPI00195A3E35|nr:ATP-binding protein [Collinsella intestinalis]MBM6908686.1 putative DNA binding domain-containing protein [Collinsella intestinalis]
MDERWLADAVSTMRQIGSDRQTVEVKEAKGGLPKSILETLSAFSNGSGGDIILGLSECRGFTLVEGFDARSTADALAHACELLTPPVRPRIEMVPFEGGTVVCARVDEMHPRDKPCYVTARNRYDGAFVRTSDGDRHLTGYEIDRLMEEHRQPLHDDEIVPDATIEDLDEALLTGFIQRQKELHPRILGTRSDAEILVDLHVAKLDDGVLRPTLAGLMALGMFPQKFFPRLNITFTFFPGVDKATPVDSARRFLDAKTIIGPIPYMVLDAVDAVSRNMRTAAVVEGAFRHDVPDYPRVAVREAVANALMHRDYSPESRGSQVQVNMFVDRLEILNPGGLYGDVTVDTLGTIGISSARNQFLSNILETTPYPEGGYVVENRGMGYQEIEQQLAHAQMTPPRPRNTTTSFTLTIDKRRILPEETSSSAQDIDGAILDYLAQRTSASTAELVRESGMARSTISSHIKGLIERGVVEPMEPARSPRQRYRLAR